MQKGSTCIERLKIIAYRPKGTIISDSIEGSSRKYELIQFPKEIELARLLTKGNEYVEKIPSSFRKCTSHDA